MKLLTLKKVAQVVLGVTSRLLAALLLWFSMFVFYIVIVAGLSFVLALVFPG